jgi:hypothetical protein
MQLSRAGHPVARRNPTPSSTRYVLHGVPADLTDIDDALHQLDDHQVERRTRFLYMHRRA